MVKLFGSKSCPNCGADLIHEQGLASGEVLLSADITPDDQRLVCQSCGYIRPVVYIVQREGRPRAQGRLAKAIRPLLAMSQMFAFERVRPSQ